MRMNSELILDTKEKLKDWLTSERKYYKNPGILQLIFPVTENDIYIKKENALIKGTTIIGTFIGRYSVFQKGLDLLLNSIEKEKAFLKEHNIIFN